MLLSLLRSMIPDAGDYQIQFFSTEHERGRSISIKISDNSQYRRMLADIAIELPKGKE